MSKKIAALIVLVIILTTGYAGYYTETTTYNIIPDDLKVPVDRLSTFLYSFLVLFKQSHAYTSLLLSLILSVILEFSARLTATVSIIPGIYGGLR